MNLLFLFQWMVCIFLWTILGVHTWAWAVNNIDKCWAWWHGASAAAGHQSQCGQRWWMMMGRGHVMTSPTIITKSTAFRYNWWRMMHHNSTHQNSMLHKPSKLCVCVFIILFVLFLKVWKSKFSLICSKLILRIDEWAMGMGKLDTEN